MEDNNQHWLTKKVSDGKKWVKKILDFLVEKIVASLFIFTAIDSFWFLIGPIFSWKSTLLDTILSLSSFFFVMVPILYSLYSLSKFETYLKKIPSLMEDIKISMNYIANVQKLDSEKEATDNIFLIIEEKGKKIEKITSTFIQSDISTLYEYKDYLQELYKKIFDKCKENIKIVNIIQIPSIIDSKIELEKFLYEFCYESIDIFRDNSFDISVKYIFDVRESNFPFLNYTLFEYENEVVESVCGWYLYQFKSDIIGDIINKKNSTKIDAKNSIKLFNNNKNNLINEQTIYIRSKNDYLCNVFKTINKNFFEKNHTDYNYNIQSTSITIDKDTVEKKFKKSINEVLNLKPDLELGLKGDSYSKTMERIPFYKEDAKYIYNNFIKKIDENEICFIDIGCGTGALLKQLTELIEIDDKLTNKTIKFIGIDIDEKQLKEAKNKFDSAKTTKFCIDFIQMDIFDKKENDYILQNILKNKKNIILFFGFNFLNLFHEYKRREIFHILYLMKNNIYASIFDIWSEKHQLKKYQDYELEYNEKLGLYSLSHSLNITNVRLLNLYFVDEEVKQIKHSRYILYLISSNRLYFEAKLAGWEETNMSVDYLKHRKDEDLSEKTEEDYYTNKMFILKKE